MPTTYNDQAIGNNFDPGVPGGLPTTVTVINITLYDSNDDGMITANGTDQVNGSRVTRVWDGDTVTLDGVSITGTTFYTADGGRYFTPTDGSVLSPGTVTSTTYVTTSTQFDVGDLGPPCFVAGTRITIPGGERDVEDLKVGDLVQTLDHGAQPVRWVGQSRVGGQGRFAPVRIQKGVLGNDRDLYVSPQHRMLVSDWRAQIFLGEDSALCAANRLCNGATVARAPCDEVIYYHIMFDNHEVIFAEGAPSESFLMGEAETGAAAAVSRELRQLFPELASPDRTQTPARVIARGFEAEMIALA